MLNDIEIRILGVLIEKALTQAGSYPLTLNSVTLGANQLQNRDPVVQYSEADVSAAVRTLTHKKLVVQAAPSSGARAVRYEHRVVDVFHWDRREQAVMAELMLRGRQTAGELRTRASRMTQIPDLEAVTAILNALKSASPPFVAELPREPGRSANRFRHLLGGTSGDEHTVQGAPDPQRAEVGLFRDEAPALNTAPRMPAGGVIKVSSAVSSGHHAANDGTVAELGLRVTTLERELGDLKSAIGELRETMLSMNRSVD